MSMKYTILIPCKLLTIFLMVTMLPWPPLAMICDVISQYEYYVNRRYENVTIDFDGYEKPDIKYMGDILHMKYLDVVVYFDENSPIIIK